jgi:carbon monoxide dehydrogenase subunit G
MDFQRSINISAPSHVVWSLMSDVEHWHEWTPSIRAIRLLGGPFEIGRRALVRQPKFPPAVWTVSALEPGRSFTWTTTGPAMRVSGHHLVDAVSDGSRVTLALRYEGVVGRLLARLTRRITERYIRLEAEGLKRRSEELARGSRA